MTELSIAERIEQAKKKAQNLKVDIEVSTLGEVHTSQAPTCTH